MKERNEDGEKVFTTRAIRYSDIMIINKDTTLLPVYADVLNTAGIPVNVNGNYDQIGVNKVEKYQDVADRVEKTKKGICRFRDFMSYMAKPYDKKRMIKLIQSFTDKEYQYIGDKELSALKDRVKKLRKYLYAMSPVAIAGYFNEHVEMIMPVEKDIDSYIYIDLQKRFNDLYEKILTNEFQSYDEIVMYIDRYLQTKTESIASMREELEAVQLLNLHKAKGLQAPIVIAADRGEELYNYKTHNYNEYKEENNYYSCFEIEFKKGGKESYHSYENDEPIMKKAEIADYLDVLRKAYVEMTRAQELLILMSVSNRRTWGILSNVTDDLDDIYTAIPRFVEPDKEIAKAVAAMDDAAASNASPEVPQAETEKTVAEEPAADYVPYDDALYIGGHGLEVKRYVTQNPSGMEHKENSNTVGEDRPKGSVFGTVMHRSFELAVKRAKEIALSGNGKESLLRGIVYQAILESESNIRDDELDKYAAYLTIKIGEFVESDIFAMILEEGTNAYPELEFSFMEEADGLCYWYNGIADLVLEKNDGSYLIVDYKSDSRIMITVSGSEKDKKQREATDAEFKEALNKRYKGQLDLYKKAVMHIFDVADEGKVSYRLYSMYEKPLTE